MKSFGFWRPGITKPDASLADRILALPLGVEAVMNSDFSATCSGGLGNASPYPGYGAQFSWMDLDGTIGQVCLNAPYGNLNEVWLEVDWQPRNVPNNWKFLGALPSWAWEALFKAGTQILMQLDEQSPGVISYDVKVLTSTESYDSGWQQFPVYSRPALAEFVFCGNDAATAARFAGLDASIRMRLTDPDVQWGAASYAGQSVFPKFGPLQGDTYPTIGELCGYRITIEDSNADQNDIDTNAWKFTQRS